MTMLFNSCPRTAFSSLLRIISYWYCNYSTKRRPHTTSFSLPDSPANPWGAYCHVQDYPWSPGIPHGNHIRLSNPPRATRPCFQVPPTAMLYAPSPIRLHHSGSSILEQTAGWGSQCIVGEIFQGTPGCPLAVPVPRSTHLIHLLPQPIPSAHIRPRKNSHPNDPSHIPTPPPGRL